MATYLEDHPPARSQYVKPRRARLTGAVVLHTAESNTDLVLPDAGAEGVARFISTRTDPGSYHTVVDSDSTVPVIPYDWEAFHEGTGGNRWSLGLSFACRAAQWPELPATWRAGALRNAATEARAMAAHVHARTGITVPARRITAAQYRAGAAGFISHAELDPTRRTDPGPAFPWDAFLSLYANTSPTTPETPPMASTNPYPAETAEALELLAQHAGYVGDRLWFGPDALAALHRLKNRAVELAAANRTSADTIQRLTGQAAAADEAIRMANEQLQRFAAERDQARAEVARLQGLADVRTVRATLDRLLPELQAATDELGRLGGQ